MFCFRHTFFCDHMWSHVEFFSETFNIRWHWSIWKSPITTHPTLSSNALKKPYLEALFFWSPRWDHDSTDLSIWDSQMPTERWKSVVKDPFWYLVEKSLIQNIIFLVNVTCLSGCHGLYLMVPILKSSKMYRQNNYTLMA